MIDATLERRLERRLAKLLQYGSYLGCASIAIGLLLGRRGGGFAPHPGLLFVTAGIVLLIALPIARLVVMLVTFVKERDHWFAVATAGVLIVIAISFVVGLLTRV